VKKENVWKRLLKKLRQERLRSHRNVVSRRNRHTHNPAGTKILKKAGFVQNTVDGFTWIRDDRGGTLTMQNPGGSVSEVFRDMGKARNKLKIENRK